MPLFFFLGGLFLDISKDFYNFVKINFIRLIIPFFIFDSLGITITYIKNFFLNRANVDIFSILINTFFYIDMNQINHYGFVLWFLPTLFWARILTYSIIKIKYKFCNIYLFTVILILTLFMLYSYNFSLVGIDKSIFAMPWVLSGYIYHNFNNIFQKYKYIFISISIFIILFFLYNFPKLDIARTYSSNYISSYLYSLSIIFALSVIFDKYNNSIFFSPFIFLGGYTLEIMIFHVYTNNIVNVIYSRIDLFSTLMKSFLSIFLTFIIIFVYLKCKNLIYFNYANKSAC